MIGYTLILGDCLKALQQMPENSIDSLVTDPPYGWRFMGKAWDGEDIIKRSNSAARKDKSRHDGKFNNEDSYKAQAAGTYDISLTGNLAFQSWTTEWARECYRVLKPGAHMLVFCGPRTYHRMASGVEDAGFEVRDQLQWLFGSGFPKSLDISKAIDKAAGAEREVTNTRNYSGPITKHDGFVSGEKVVGRRTIVDTAPSTDAAKKWQGYGTALKPANEPILLARKPLSEKTVAANVLKWGTGGINIDGCRIASEGMPKSCTNQNIRNNSYVSDNSKRDRDTIYNPSPQGRFPANLLLDEEGAKMLDEQSGNCKSAGNYKEETRLKPMDCSRSMFPLGGRPKYGNEQGGASRFFYCAKASKSERNLGCEKSNGHPTVKPLRLMRYLCRLITPPNGICLDPFMGSGSTGIAALQEGFRFIGIEREDEYMEIAKARLFYTKQKA